MKDKGIAHIGIGNATGDDKAIDAMKIAVSSPLLETTIEGATNVLINIAGDVSLPEVHEQQAMFRSWQVRMQTLSSVLHTMRMQPMRLPSPLSLLV